MCIFYALEGHWLDDQVEFHITSQTVMLLKKLTVTCEWQMLSSSCSNFDPEQWCGSDGMNVQHIYGHISIFGGREVDGCFNPTVDCSQDRF